MRPGRDGGNGGTRGDRFRLAASLVLDHHSIGASGLQSCAQTNFDSALGQEFVRESRERLSQLRQDSLSTLKQDQAQIFLGDIVINANGIAQEIVHFSDTFDAGETTACDYEC